MTPGMPVKKDQFYTTLITLLSEAQHSVHFYSISCCYGFYSFGVKNFEAVLVALRERLTKKYRGKYMDVRVLVKVDPENPMDEYAARRLASVEQAFARTGDEVTARQVFRRLFESRDPDDMVQFIIVDGARLLVSRIQEEYYNESLDLVLNVSQDGTLFDSTQAPEDFAKYSDLFTRAWNSSAALNVEVPALSRRKLRYVLERYTGFQKVQNERELQLLLAGYLQGHLNPAIVDFEATIGGTRIDLLVGPRPHSRRHGIELKLKPDDGAIHAIVGQIRDYRGEYEDLILIVAQPKYTPQKRLQLISELEQVGVTLIELR